MIPQEIRSRPKSANIDQSLEISVCAGQTVFFRVDQDLPTPLVIEPPAPVDKDIYELPPDEMAEIDQVPTSLDAVLEALEADHDYLTVGGVFTDDLIETWIHFKRTQEIAPVQLRPHPHEFELYYDI